MDRDTLNALSRQIVDAAFEVHTELGPGLLESVYQFAMEKEFELRGIVTASKVPIQLFYKGHPTTKFYEMDMLVEGQVVLEFKAVETLHPIFSAQLISYLKLADKRLGFLINFNVPLIKDGIKRFVNNF